MIKNRVLLVQCCDLPQLFHVAAELRKQHPDWQIDFLVTSQRQIQFYPNYFRCADVHILPSRDNDFSDYSTVLFPLLNRGYAKIKKRAWSIRSRKLQVDSQGNLEDLNAFRLTISVFRAIHKPVREFEDFVRQFPFPELGKKILIIESCHPSLIKETASKLESTFPADAKIHRVGQGSLLQKWKELRRQRIDGAVVYFSDEKGFLGLRLLPFVLRIKNLLVISENGDFSAGEPRDLARFFYRRFAIGARFFHKAPRVLFLQTEGPAYTAECLNRLRESDLFPNARILLICREKDRVRLEGLEGVEKTVSWKKDRRFSQSRPIWREIKEFKPDLNCAAFTGRPVFRLQKLSYFLLGSRHKLAFNANHDAYWMSPRTVHRVFKKEPFKLPLDQATEVLLLGTSSDESMLEALRKLQKAEVVPNARITFFCREDKAALFEGRTGVVKIVTYSKQSLRSNFLKIWELFKIRPDVLAAVFAGSKIYAKHRLLFWLLPARNRLAFNQNLDCFYVNRTTFHLLFRATSGTPQSIMRIGLRGVLFLPRFLYLLAWWTGWKLGFIRAR